MSTEVIGLELTEKGLPVEPGPVGLEGVHVVRDYALPDHEARIGAKAVGAGP